MNITKLNAFEAVNRRNGNGYRVKKKIPGRYDIVADCKLLGSPLRLFFAVPDVGWARVNLFNPAAPGPGLSTLDKTHSHIVIPGSEPRLVSNTSPA